VYITNHKNAYILLATPTVKTGKLQLTLLVYAK